MALGAYREHAYTYTRIHSRDESDYKKPGTPATGRHAPEKTEENVHINCIQHSKLLIYHIPLLLIAIIIAYVCTAAL